MGVRAQMLLAAAIGLLGFAVGLAIGVEHMGWRLGLLVALWPALFVGAGAAWTVGIGFPELSALLARVAVRNRDAARR